MPDIYYVSQDSGNDAYNIVQAQDPATPWKTLSHAFYVAGYSTPNPAGDGNTIVINDSAIYSVTNGIAGTDNTSNQIDVTTNWLPTDFIIKAGAGCSPILDGGHVADFAIKTYNDWVIEGITFRKFGSIISSHSAITQTSSHKTAFIRDCTIYAISGSAIIMGAVGTLVERCLIYDIADEGISGFYQFTVQNNIIYDCYSYAIYGGAAGGSAASTVVQHNTIHNCPADGSTNSSRQAAVHTNNAQFNIITDASCTLGGLRVIGGSSSYNCVSGTYDHAGVASPSNYYGGPGTGDIQTDPLFTNKSSDDFTLGPGSPCIGTANGSSSKFDFVSGSRYWNYDQEVIGVNVGALPHDMGGYELNHTSVCGVDTKNISKVMGVA
jgi:hypothetical protein